MTTGKTWDKRPQEPNIACPELAARLRKEDIDFERHWRKYWEQRGKWKDFEEFLKHAA